MLYFIARRVLQMIPTVIAVSLLIFVVFSVVPGSIASGLIANGKGMNDPKMVEKITQEFGLDKPVHVRFGNYLVQLAQFDLGTSYRSSSRLFRSFRNVCGQR